MTVGNMEAQQEHFRARLKRIEKRGENTLGKVYVGEGGSVDAKKLRKAKNTVARKQAKRTSLVGRLFGIVFAGALGFVALMAARVALFHLIGMRDPLVEMTTQLWQEAASALAIGTVLALIFGTLRKAQFLGMALGVIAGVGLAHNTVHLFPDYWDKATSPVYTNAVLSSSMPHSVVLMDQMMLF